MHSTSKFTLTENYFISERIKHLIYNNFYGNYYFWRTQNQQEIDFVEEVDGKLSAYEIKWKSDIKVKFPAKFKEVYPDSEFCIVNRDNYYEYLTSIVR